MTVVNLASEGHKKYTRGSTPTLAYTSHKLRPILQLPQSIILNKHLTASSVQELE